MKHNMGSDDFTSPGFGLANKRSTTSRIPKVFSILTLVFLRGHIESFCRLAAGWGAIRRGWEALPSRTPLKKTQRLKGILHNQYQFKEHNKLNYSMYSRHPLLKSLSEVMDRPRPLCHDNRDISHPQKKHLPLKKLPADDRMKGASMCIWHDTAVKRKTIQLWHPCCSKRDWHLIIQAAAFSADPCRPCR